MYLAGYTARRADLRAECEVCCALLTSNTAPGRASVFLNTKKYAEGNLCGPSHATLDFVIL